MLICSSVLQEQQKAEMKAIQVALEAQSEALKELKLESEELYQAALKPDSHLFPLNQEGLAFTPAKSTHEAPDGKYSDVTKVYTQWWIRSEWWVQSVYVLSI